MAASYDFDWADLAFASKKPLNDLQATFILAPRQISTGRFRQIIKQFLPKGNIVLGLAKESFVAGFEGQPHFRTLQVDGLRPLISKVNSSASKRKIYTLSYTQTDATYIVEKLNFAQVLLINGSWHYSFHTTSLYYQLVTKGTPHYFLSPFSDEDEAKTYAEQQARELSIQLPLVREGRVLDDAGMLAAAEQAARHSYDYSYQTGLSLGKKTATGYKLLTSLHNVVVPYESYALHHGNSREKHFSPPHDLNHYDTVHAEINLLTVAATRRIPLTGATLFTNLLPCPPCARALAAGDISEVVYSADHSDGYAVYMLEASGKVVRRLVPVLPD